MVTRTYTMNFGTLAAPGFDPVAGNHTSEAVVAISAMSGATIRYTTNGTGVTGSSPIYTGPISVSATTTIKARAYHIDYTTSSETSGLYTIVVATPQLSHTAGTYSAGQVVTISTATTGATLHYTLNGSTPTTSDPVVPANGIVVGNFTLKVGAWKAGCTPSTVVTAAYDVTGSLATAQVAAGDAHSLAVRPDGVFWSWGLNGSGQLGDGTTTQRTLPILVGGVTGAIALAAGGTHSLAVRHDGSLYAWGANGNGQLGDGSTTGKHSPLLVSGLTSVVAAAAGSNHTLVLRSDGNVWSFGRNSEGQLGDTTTTQRTSPVQSSALADITAVTARSLHSLALKNNGTVWSWGNNANGQLGTGNTTSRSTPGTVSGITTAVAVAAGGSHALALLADGTVRAWGSNVDGQLGDSTNFQRTSPVAVTGLTNVTAIAAGGSFSVALLNDGTVRAWGQNGAGQLGDGTTTDRNAPVTVQGLSNIVFIAAGSAHALAVASDGSVWAWGANGNGRLGDGTTTNRSTPVSIANAGMIWKVPAPVLSLASGLYFSEQTVTVTSGDPDATLHYTTSGASPTQADPTVASGGTVPVNITLTLKVRAWKPGAVASEVSTGSYELKVVAPAFSPSSGAYGSAQNVSLTTSTASATFTYTIDGTEPLATSTAYSGPIGVSDTRTLKARAFRTGWTASDSTAASYWISSGTVATPTITPAGGSHSFAPLVTLSSTTTGAIIRYTLDGSEPHHGSLRYQFPFLIDRTSTVKAGAFAAGMISSAVATASFSLDAAGQTAPPTISPMGGRFATKRTVTIDGPAGATLRYTTNGTDPSDTDPTIVSGGTIVVDRAQIVKVRAWLSGSTPSEVRRADFWVTGAIAAGHQHSLALKADGTVLAWGRGTEGQLGDGTFNPTVETPVTAMSDAVAIAGGERHSLAVRNDGSVWAWGLNTYGRLGDGTTTNRPSPVQALGLSNVITVAAGYDHSLALKSDGTVWAWGRNGDGQLGDGTTTDRSSAVQVVGLSGVTAIAAGDGFSLAVQHDGSAQGFVWAWGRNTGGRLGDGSVLPRPVPVRVSGLQAAFAAAGQAFGAAVASDGLVATWGDNTKTQLGTMTVSSVSAPVSVPSLRGIAAIAAGAAHALGVDLDGRVWVWGDNSDAQLANASVATGPQTGVPQQMTGISAAIAAAAGWQQSLLLRADGSVWAAGSSAATGLGSGVHPALARISGLSLVDNASLFTDADGDGLSAWREYLAGLDPLAGDTDGNGLSDAIDILAVLGANPDDDGDGVSNAREAANGTDPFLADTDGDAVSDLLDAFPLDPTRSQAPSPNPSDTTPPTISLIYPASARPVGGGGN